MAFHLSRLFGTRHAPLLGIDIGASGIRVIELTQSGKRVQVEHYASEMLPYGALRDDSIMQFDQVTDALRRALKKSGSRCRNAALALPSGSVISKTLSMPANLSEAELDAQIEIEASQSLPFALDEISLDYGVIGPSAMTPDANEILLVAARKDKINERLALAEAAGIKPLVMDIEAHAARAAMANLFARDAGLALIDKLNDRLTDRPTDRLTDRLTDSPAEAHTVALVQIGSEASSLTVLQGQRMLYEREHAFGSHKFEQELARASSPVQAIHDGFNEVVTQELGRALQLFFSSTAHDSITHIYLAGNSVHTPGLVALLVQRTATGVTLADPFSGMHIASAISESQLKIDAPSCLVACGLAMRSFAQ